MLKRVIRTPEQKESYLNELRGWLAASRDEPIEGMADFFANRVDIYEDVHLGHWAQEYAHIADYFDDGLQTLLDIGCGTGLELRSIYRRFPDAQITGVDLSEAMLKKLRKTYEGKAITLVHADYFEYPFAMEAFDAALSFETLHHFRREKKLEIYQKLYRTIRRGGYYIECDYIACCPEEEALCLENYEYRRGKNKIPEAQLTHIDIPLTLEHQIALLTEAGFQSTEVLHENEGTMILKAVKA